MGSEMDKDIHRELVLIRRLPMQSAVADVAKIEGYERFASIGLEPREIAEFYGVTAHAVSVALSNKRRVSNGAAKKPRARKVGDVDGPNK